MSDHVFFNGCETHYGLRSRVDPTEYPQVHDFYEIILVVAGKLFLYDTLDKLEDLAAGVTVPICSLTGLESTLLQNRLAYLNLLPSGSIKRKNTYLRSILIEIIFSDIMTEIEKKEKENQRLAIPTWMAQAIEGLSDLGNLEDGMDYLVQQTKRTPEHICRAFRKYLNMTPMTFINAKRLNYAANLLKHTDKEIIDIAYESGFQSVSHFYHLFKKEYQISPLKYRNQNGISYSL